MTTKFFQRAGLVATAAALAFGAAAANAVTIYEFQGVTFTTAMVDSNTFTLRIQNATAATGDWTGITSLGAFALKQDGGDVSTASITDLSDTLWDFTNNGLSANGCGTGETISMCFTMTPKYVFDDDFMFTIDFSGTGLDAAAPWHLMVNFYGPTCGGGRNHDGKCGSNLSQYISSGGSVPEPGSLSLLGLGLLGIGFMRRARKAA